MNADAMKYHRTVDNTMGLDDRQAMQYITRNGVSVGPDNKYFLDRSLSTDWKFSAPPSQSIGTGAKAAHNYSYTGANLSKTSKALAAQMDETLGEGYKWKPERKGDVFQTQESLMAKSISGEEVLNAAKDHLFSNNQDDELQYAMGDGGYKKVMTNSNYLATLGQKSEGGYSLTDEQKKAQELLNINIAGSTARTWS